jgi:hypothetical protein
MQVQFQTIRNRGAIVAQGMSIRRDIPAPPNTRRTKYPFPDMTIGDCLVLEAGHPGTKINLGGTCSAQGSAHSYAKRHGVAFRSQILPNGNVHIWRVA